ncbi:hypothetical protein MGYG_06245 [Nannizzia gypsea CBS 118893]|uniref:Uncharacterized protein n=1 Tax=Arthroderma gypseum (strain ATCC MYA-4604 / CBS 118893) TaxID=535722 RepID=E4UYR3_ARTGP|nr:hypothetical protein MGYG_06245 [Nannizzia gypsea CBS 118893]EFR03243.1 hypothetical protein MGYG_06245 [Nannizzia gypsea CBS 118893]
MDSCFQAPTEPSRDEVLQASTDRWRRVSGWTLLSKMYQVSLQTGTNRIQSCRSYWCIGEGNCHSNHLELDERLLFGIPTPTSCKIAGTIIQEGRTMNVHEDGFSAEAHARWGGVSGRTDQLPRQYCCLHSRSFSYGGVLAPGVGWEATISTMQRNYYSPWSVSNDTASGFLVRAVARDSGTHISVTSSEQAFEYLSRFCQRKKIQEQCLMGLATSLMFPTHNLTGVPVRLVSAESPIWQMEVSDDEKNADMEFTRTGPGTVFYLFNSAVPCVFCSQWLLPGIELLETLPRRQVAPVLSQYCPSLATWWTGAIFSGIHEYVFRMAKNATPPISHSSAWWTRSSQSFHCCTISTPSENKQIPRFQEALLLYLFEPLWDHEGPISPWRPIGTIGLRDAMIQVQIHSKCGSRHFLKYKHWSWSEASGEYQDTGYSCGSDVIGKQNLDITIGLAAPIEMN